MHPAASVIFFTTFSGLGYGLIVSLCLGVPLQLLELSNHQFAAALCVGMVLAGFGLTLSLFHLGHPERAWRALSQWRSSWLSREGVLAILAFLPTILLTATLLFAGPTSDQTIVIALSLVAASLSMATVFATAMIYRTLRAIDAWHNNWVPLVYLSLAVMSGAVLAVAIATTVGRLSATTVPLVIALIVTSGVIKMLYWRHVRNAAPTSDIASALGLDNQAKARQFSAPHTADNYLMTEMGYQIARNHAQKLRKICVGVGFVAPLALLNLGLLFATQMLCISAWLSVMLVFVGIVIERWLFFAEAKHTVMTYYGR